MKRKALYNIIWKSVLCGFLYEIFYQIALALRWMTKAEGYSFIAAAFTGVIIALIIKQDKTIHTVITTISSLALAFMFNLIAIRLSIPWKILTYFDPFMEVIGHTTANEGITILFVTGGYLIISFIVFLATLGIRSMVSNKKMTEPPNE